MPTIFRHKVQIGPVSFNDRSLFPEGAQQWGVDIMEGWRSGPERKVVSVELGGDVDGEAAVGSFAMKARHLIVGGYILAATAERAEELHDILIREALPGGKEIVMVRHESTPKFLRVRREGPIETEWPLENGFRWSTAIMAPDPLKYALNSVEGSGGVSGLSSGGRTYPRLYPLVYTTISGGSDHSVALFNAGTVSTPPMAVLTGPLVRGAWRLANETVGSYLQFDVSLLPGDILEIDFRNEIALLNGYPITATVVGDFWRVVPGANIIKLYADSIPGAGFTVSIQSAWE